MPGNPNQAAEPEAPSVRAGRFTNAEDHSEPSASAPCWTAPSAALDGRSNLVVGRPSGTCKGEDDGAEY